MTDIPIMILSAHVMPAETRRIRDAGCDVGLSRPCPPRVLDLALLWLLDERAGAVR